MKRSFLLLSGVVPCVLALAHCSVNEDGSCHDDSTCAPTLLDGGSGLDGTVSDANADVGATTDGSDSAADGPVTSDDAGFDSAPSCDPTQTPAENACVIADGLAIFVAPSGSDSTGTGTMEAPVATIAKAISLAATTATHRVIACAASYPVAIALSAPASDFGLQLFGGVACPSGDAGASDGGVAWSYTGAKAVVAPTTQGAPGYALSVAGLTTALDIEDFEFDALSTTVEGQSSVAAFFNANTGSVTLNRVAAKAGSAATSSASLAGATPTTAIPVAENGTSGADGGTAVDCHCANSGADTVGGKGGTDGSTTTGGGNSGTPSLGGGAGGQAGAFCTPNGEGGNGDGAAASAAGAGASAYGTLSSTGWTAAPGLAGSSGAPGQGGGGGNSGGSTGVGGGGACGGCGGNPAAPGLGGGSSIALLVLQTTVTITDSALTVANAESGGAGAIGQAGGAGGTGGVNFSAGCPGGNGGTGGTGAASGGGAGGLSVGAFWSGTKPTLDSATQTAFIHGTAGAGGKGGSTPTNDGISGVAQVTYP